VRVAIAVVTSRTQLRGTVKNVEWCLSSVDALAECLSFVGAVDDLAECLSFVDVPFVDAGAVMALCLWMTIKWSSWRERSKT
jgi:hypothetical protein